jgi:hypothetical protein
MQILQPMLFQQTVNRAPFQPKLGRQIAGASFWIQRLGPQHFRFPFRCSFAGAAPQRLSTNAAVPSALNLPHISYT